MKHMSDWRLDEVLWRARVLLAFCACLAACDGPSAPVMSAKRALSSSESAPPAIAEADFALFDRVVTAESVFPDGAQRGLYRMLPPVTENGQRSYTFQLKPQRGMDEARDFNLVTITWARGGQLVKSPGLTAAPSGTVGPN